MLADRRALLVNWWHDPDFADDTPFGATVVILEKPNPREGGGPETGG